MKSKLLKVSKVALLLVVIGFFMPISCNLNGVHIIRVSYSPVVLHGTIVALPLIVIIVFACLSIILTLYCILTNKNESLVLDWILIGISIACGLFLLIFPMRSEYIKLQYGAYVVFTGWILSLIFLIAASLARE